MEIFITTYMHLKHYRKAAFMSKKSFPRKLAHSDAYVPHTRNTFLEPTRDIELIVKTISY